MCICTIEFNVATKMNERRISVKNKKGQNVWKSGFQDSAHQARKETDSWEMRNKWSEPHI